MKDERDAKQEPDYQPTKEDWQELASAEISMWRITPVEGGPALSLSELAARRKTEKQKANEDE